MQAKFQSGNTEGRDSLGDVGFDGWTALESKLFLPG